MTAKPLRDQRFSYAKLFFPNISSLNAGLRSQNNPANCFGEPSNETFLLKREKRTEQKDIVGIG